jgi:hypothetical protein
VDEIGMALESFNTIGSTRQVYGYAAGKPIEDRGTLADGTIVMGEPALADALARDPRFLPCVARQLMRYGLARELESEDEPRLEAIVARWKSGVPTLRALVEELVLDDAFRLRTPEGSP